MSTVVGYLTTTRQLNILLLNDMRGRSLYTWMERMITIPTEARTSVLPYSSQPLCHSAKLPSRFLMKNAVLLQILINLKLCFRCEVFI